VLGAFLQGISDDDSPVIEHALRERLAGSCLAEIGSETEGLGNGKVRLDLENGGSDTLLLLDNATTTPVQASVDSTNGLLGASDVHEVDGLQETRLGCEAARVHDTTGSGHDLTGTAVDRVGVHGNIQQVPTDTAAILLGKNTLLGGDLEAADNGVLNFVEVLHGLGGVDDEVGAGGFGSKPQILRASLMSHSYFSFKILARAFSSSRGAMVPFSISSTSSSWRGLAVMYKRLCLLGDLERQI